MHVTFDRDVMQKGLGSPQDTNQGYALIWVKLYLLEENVRKT